MIFSKIYLLIESIAKKLLGLLELFLFLRLILKFLGASSKALVVNLIYKYSDILVSPFNFIFPNIRWRDYLIDTATISAMIGYAILIYIIFQILKLFSKD